MEMKSNQHQRITKDQNCRNQKLQMNQSLILGLIWPPPPPFSGEIAKEPETNLNGPEADESGSNESGQEIPDTSDESETSEEPEPNPGTDMAPTPPL